MIFTILDTLQLKKLGYNINSVNPLYLRIDNASGYMKKQMEISTWFLMLQMKIKSYQKNAMIFLMELWIKLEKQMMIGWNIQKTT